jgi:FK506-binding protein 2
VKSPSLPPSPSLSLTHFPSHGRAAEQVARASCFASSLQSSFWSFLIFDFYAMGGTTTLLMLFCTLLLAFGAASVSAKACKGEDLPDAAKLRVGVKHRPETCSRKAQKGDKVVSNLSWLNMDKWTRLTTLSSFLVTGNVLYNQLSIHYTGKLYKDCSVFDSSLERGEPFGFTLGMKHVIAGWDQGVLGMCIGEKRRLTIPSALGYGESGAGDKIPGGATLLFEVELLDITN